MLAGHNEDDDVFDDVATPSTCRQSTDTETDSSTDRVADVDRSRYHHRHTWNADAKRPAYAIEDELRLAAADDDDDQRPSNEVSVAVDLERRKSGFQRRRLGQLQLKHRLAVDLPDQSSPATRWTHPEESGFVTNGQATTLVGRPSNLVPGKHNEPVLNSVWNSLDDSDHQFYIVFVVALATLAVALNVPPAWLILTVAGLSLLLFSIDERRRAKPR